MFKKGDRVLDCHFGTGTVAGYHVNDKKQKTGRILVVLDNPGYMDWVQKEFGAIPLLISDLEKVEQA